MATIQQVLQGIYKTSGKALFLDEDLFINQLIRHYEPGMKEDCRLLERAIRSGAGKIVIQFLQRGRQPSPEETETFINMLQSRANFTKKEASRIVELLYQMVSFPLSNQGRGSTNPPKLWKWSSQGKHGAQKITFSSLMKLPFIHLLLSLV